MTDKTVRWFYVPYSNGSILLTYEDHLTHEYYSQEYKNKREAEEAERKFFDECRENGFTVERLYY